MFRSEPTRSSKPDRKALANQPLQQGVTVTTGIGLAEVEFENGATGYVGDNSVLEFTELGISATRRVTRLMQKQGTGRFFANVTDNGRHLPCSLPT